MRRTLEDTLKNWKEKGPTGPLLIRGARQVGKTYLVEKFGQEYFGSVITINFDLQTEYKSCFTTKDPSTINNLISAISKQKIVPGTTLLFLDEIQECPEAIMALRYYKEKMPDLHVIAAGSLLEFVLNTEEMRMPVGRVNSLYLKPMSFDEFLLATSYDGLLDYIVNASLTEEIPKSVVTKLEEMFRLYTVIGGMPAVVQNYIEQQSFDQTNLIQASLLNTFRNDFGKYAKLSKHKYLQQVFTKAPGMVSSHIKYAAIDPDMLSRDLKSAIEVLQEAGLIYQVFLSKATGLPLNSLINHKYYKILFLDIGLAKCSSNLGLQTLLQEDIMLVNNGNLVEQFVGQELLAHKPPYMPGELFYWGKNNTRSTAEVDYVINVDDKIFPIEVKAGKTGRLRSMRCFLEHTNKNTTPFGIKVSLQPLSYKENILSIPLYMLSQVTRLVMECLAHNI